MTTIQGEFESKEAAQGAKSSLIAAGVPAKSIRLWNIIPDSKPFVPDDDYAEESAIIGGAVAGAEGVAAGTTVGATVERDYNEEEDEPQKPPGFYLAVDSTPEGPDIAGLLNAAGAENVRQVSKPTNRPPIWPFRKAGS
jgi:hypothetical protein